MGTVKRASVNRRAFLRSSLSGFGLVTFSALVDGAGSARRFRAAIIGATGRGNYGHDHDLVFKGRDDVEVVAVADADEAGLNAAKSRAGALRAYADYHEMLEKEQPDLVCVAPRWTDQHFAMAMAAVKQGAHVYIEKPITQNLAEADALLVEAEKKDSKIVVAHQIRLAPNILYLKQCLREGLIGELLEIRALGKQDSRAGGEDLVVLGVHLFDLMRFYAGDAMWCSARVLQGGHEITLLDGHSATEQIGRIAGDDIVAEFAFAEGVLGTFTSRRGYREVAGPWGLELIGSKGRIRILTEMIPTIYTLQPLKWQGNPKTDQWRLWEQDPTLKFDTLIKGFAHANARVVEDWLTAIRTGQQAKCSGYAGMKALEMAHAVFVSGLSRSREQLPLKKRSHPLGD